MSQQIDFQTAANDLYSCAVYLAEKIKNSGGRYEALSSLVNVCLAKNDVDAAAEFADSIDEDSWRDTELLKVVNKCIELKDYDYALQLTEAMESFGEKSDGILQIGKAKIAENKIEEAFDLAEKTSETELIYGNAALKNYESGNTEKAFEQLDFIASPEIKTNFLLNLADQDLKKSLKTEAVESIEEALQSAREITVEEQKIYSLLAVAYAFSEAGRKDRQIEVVSETLKVGETLDSVHRNNLLSLISKAFLDAGSVELADKALDLIHDKTIIASTLSAYSEVFRQQGNQTEAEDTLREAIGILKSQTDREIRDSNSRFAVLGKVAVNFAEIGKLDEAIQIAAQNPSDNERFTSLSRIAKIAASENQDIFVEKAINSISLVEEKIAAKISVSDSMVEKGDTEKAISILDDCVSDLKIIEQAFSKFNLLEELCRRFYNWGQDAKARACAEEMLENAALIKDESRKVNAIAELSEIHRKYKYQLNEKEKGTLQTLLRRAEW